MCRCVTSTFIAKDLVSLPLSASLEINTRVEPYQNSLSTARCAFRAVSLPDGDPEEPRPAGASDITHKRSAYPVCSKLGEIVFSHPLIDMAQISPYRQLTQSRTTTSHLSNVDSNRSTGDSVDQTSVSQRIACDYVLNQQACSLSLSFFFLSISCPGAQSDPPGFPGWPSTQHCWPSINSTPLAIYPTLLAIHSTLSTVSAIITTSHPYLAAISGAGSCALDRVLGARRGQQTGRAGTAPARCTHRERRLGVGAGVGSHGTWN